MPSTWPSATAATSTPALWLHGQHARTRVRTRTRCTQAEQVGRRARVVIIPLADEELSNVDRGPWILDPGPWTLKPKA
eukprot:1957510-Rhodomonas_salina.1